MATVTEMFDSQSGIDDVTNPSATRRFFVQDADGLGDAQSAVMADLPAAFFNLFLRSVTYTALGGGKWTAEASYATVPGGPEVLDTAGGGGGGDPPAQPGGGDALDESYSFDTTGGTQHITQSQQTRDAEGRNGAAVPNFDRAIGVSDDGVEGVDIVAPRLEFQITRNFAVVTLDYVKTLRDLTGTTNDDAWMGFEQGELLFLGASGSSNGNKFQIQFKFSAGKNRDVGVIVPDPLGGLLHVLKVDNPRGHDYIWITYEDAEEADTLILRPKGAYLERVYDESDFTLLGLG